MMPHGVTETQGQAALSACEALLARHLASVVRAYGANGLGVIDLPPLGPEPVIVDQVGIAAVLYWCRELDRAGPLPFVEALARAVAEGELSLPLGLSAQRLMPFWRPPHHRFTAPERQSLYERVFPTAPPDDFDKRLAQLALAVARIGRQPRDRSILHLQVRAGHLAQELAGRLSTAAVGLAGFAARDTVRQIRDAMGVLKDPEIVQALGGGTPAAIIARWGRLLGRAPDLVASTIRAENGFVMLRFIAEAVPDVVGAFQQVNRNHPVVAAAEAWLGTVGGHA